MIGEQINERQRNRVNRHVMGSEEYRNLRDSRNSEPIKNRKTSTTTDRLAERTRPNNVENNAVIQENARNSGKIESSNWSSFSISKYTSVANLFVFTLLDFKKPF